MRTTLRDKLEVCTVLPDLRGCVTVVTKAQNVFAWFQSRRNFHLIQNAWVESHARLVARWREGVRAPGVARRVVASGAVAAWGLWAREAGTGGAVAGRAAATFFFTLFAPAGVVLGMVPMGVVSQIASAAVAITRTGERHPAPSRAWGVGTFVDEDWVRHRDP